MVAIGYPIVPNPNNEKMLWMVGGRHMMVYGRNDVEPAQAREAAAAFIDAARGVQKSESTVPCLFAVN